MKKKHFIVVSLLLEHSLAGISAFPLFVSFAEILSLKFEPTMVIPPATSILDVGANAGSRLVIVIVPVLAVVVVPVVVVVTGFGFTFTMNPFMYLTN